MKAAYIEKTGASDVINFGNLPSPMVGEMDVLVKVQAVAVDPVDTYIRRGSYSTEKTFPFIIGRDMVGIVADVGSGVRAFSPGDPVWCNNQGYAGRQGTFAEFVSVQESLLYHLPDGVEPVNAVASVHSALTAIVGLKAKAQLQQNEILFINGGSGNVGVCATQLAKAIGAKVIVTAGSSEKKELCLQAGADAIVNYKEQDIVSAVRELAPEGVHVYWDLTPRPEVQTALALIRRRARILLSSGLMHESTFKVGDFYTRNATIYGFTITDLDTDELAGYAELINREFTRGTFKTQIARTLLLSEAATAHQLVEQGEVNGKIILRVEE
jgi:NADPH2:quinone reductase